MFCLGENADKLQNASDVMLIIKENMDALLLDFVVSVFYLGLL